MAVSGVKQYGPRGTGTVWHDALRQCCCRTLAMAQAEEPGAPQGGIWPCCFFWRRKWTRTLAIGRRVTWPTPRRNLAMLLRRHACRMPTVAARQTWSANLHHDVRSNRFDRLERL